MFDPSPTKFICCLLHVKMCVLFGATTAALWYIAAILLCDEVNVADGYLSATVIPSYRHISSAFFEATWSSNRQALSKPTARLFGRAEPPPDFTIEDDYEDNSSSISSSRDGGNVNGMTRIGEDEYNAIVTSPHVGIASPNAKPKRRLVRQANNNNNGASWMQRNSQFTGTDDEDGDDDVSSPRRPSSPSSFSSRGMRSDRESKRTASSLDRNGEGDNKSFRQDFRGTRVFVQGLPIDCSWQTLKDHFKMAGNVVFASVSTDSITGRGKGCGIVQYETTNEALNAIRMMRSFPLDNCELFVREDVQDTGSPDQPWSKQQSSGSPRGPTPPSKWKCANGDEATERLGEDAIKAIQQLLKARDQARRRRNYDASDAMREELRQTHNVQLDDRLTLWWVGSTGTPPTMIQDIKGDGRWGEKALSEWRQIPTTPESDACVDPDLVFGLLKQRDIARREKDFKTADALLEQARQAPDGDLYLRIHDESRTWRIWTDEAPKRPVRHDSDQEEGAATAAASPAEQCIALCMEHAPEKIDEVKSLLEKFPGREYNILKKLRQRYS